MAKLHPQPSKEQLAASSLYGGLMGEALIRIAAIDHGTMNKSGLIAPFVQEFCYLQLRKICELMALGCLVAHGEIEGTSGMHTQWSADKIIKRLSNLHEDFFPLLMQIQLDPQGHNTMTHAKGGMTKEDMLQVYYECDKYLHSGSLKKLLKKKTPLRVNYPEITARAQRFRSLVESHTVVMKGGENLFICYLKGPDELQVAIAKTMDEPPLELGSGFYMRGPDFSAKKQRRDG